MPRPRTVRCRNIFVWKSAVRRRLYGKYFAPGKVQFHLNRFADALLFAAKCRHDGPLDFVFELLARTYLAMGTAGKAREAVATKVCSGWLRPTCASAVSMSI